MDNKFDYLKWFITILSQQSQFFGWDTDYPKWINIYDYPKWLITRTGGVLTGFLMLDLDETFCCFQVFQEPPHPPRLQGETWRTGGVLTRFLILDLDETFTEASEV